MDGVNCMTFERCHPDFYRDTEKYDHKLNGCGLNYDIGMHLFQDGLIWINGPYKSGDNNDRGNFVEHVLRDKLKTIVKKALGDKIYNGNPNEISTFNAFDCDEVTKFKARAQMWHDKLNGKMKEFQLIQVNFVIPDDETCAAEFEAIAVLVQFRLERGEYLFDILTGIEIEE